MKILLFGLMAFCACGAAAHNTIRVNGRDQAIPVHAFRWAEPPEVKLLAWETTPEQDYFDGFCRYGGFEHRHRVVFLKRDLVMLVLDEIQGLPGALLVEQFWHFALPPQKVADRQYRIGREPRIWFSLAGAVKWRWLKAASTAGDLPRWA